MAVGRWIRDFLNLNLIYLGGRIVIGDCFGQKSSEGAMMVVAAPMSMAKVGQEKAISVSALNIFRIISSLPYAFHTDGTTLIHIPFPLFASNCLIDTLGSEIK